MRIFEGCPLEQALLLHCIYETRIVGLGLSRREPLLYQPSQMLFDFNGYPSLQEYFDTMPSEVQAFLKPFIIRIFRQQH